MPTFRFEFLDGEASPPITADMPTEEAARQEALNVTRQIMLDGMAEGADPTGWLTRVYDEAGYLVATVTFADITGELPEKAKAGSVVEPDGSTEAAAGVIRAG